MSIIENYIIYFCVIGWGTYGLLIVPYFGAKILQKTGESERFWFLILAIFNFWALLIIILRPSFRVGISEADFRKLIFFEIGYVAFFAVIIGTLESLDTILAKVS